MKASRVQKALEICSIRSPERNNLAKWKDALPKHPEFQEELSSDALLYFPIWRSLNRLRVGVSKCKPNLAEWVILSDVTII